MKKPGVSDDPSPAQTEDLPDVLALLQASELPLDGVREHIATFLVIREGGRLLGTIGLETYGDVGLLRSLAVATEHRSAGHGARLVESLLERARGAGLVAIYLLTTTADRYFPKHGFDAIAREEADPRLASSAEFRGACPDSAVCMRRRLYV